MPVLPTSDANFGAGAGTIYWRDNDGDGLPEPYYVDGSSAAQDAALAATLGGPWTPERALAHQEATASRTQQQYQAAAEIQAQREAAAAGYLGRVQAGQRAALAEQQLGLGGLTEQQMAMGARGPLAQRAALYGQSRAAGEMIGQRAQQAAAEEMAAQAMLQQTYGAGAAQTMQQAQQQLQGYGMARQAAAAKAQRAEAEAEADKALIQQAAMGAIGAAGGAMAASDRQLKMGVRRPRTGAEAELYEALKRGM